MEMEIYVDWNGTKKQFNVLEVIPTPCEHGDRERKRLFDGMIQLQSKTRLEELAGIAQREA